MQELRLINYTANGALVGLSIFLAASQFGNPSSAAAGPSAFGAVTALAQQGWQLYEFFIDSHPVVTKVCQRDSRSSATQQPICSQLVLYECCC